MNPCTCRDCMELATSPNSLCWECVDADCVAYSEADHKAGIPSHVYDCKREGAYESADSRRERFLEALARVRRRGTHSARAALTDARYDIEAHGEVIPDA